MGTAARGQDPLDLGIAAHAFDHLDVSDQAVAAAASGSTIIYTTGVGTLGYAGLPAADKLDATGRDVSAYLRDARQHGIRLAIGYVCATSIVKLDHFDQNWSAEFRKQFSTPPSSWLQRDKTGAPLASWYGGDYRPACMNNPDWITYEKAIVRRQLEAGCDGIFFDNPTVHEQGCYCDHCMVKFGKYLDEHGAKKDLPATNAIDALRQQAIARTDEFRQFRSTTARDFLGEMRAFARTIKPAALITCNNSLNSPDVFFTQCRSMGYNIYEMSKTEDFVVLEDMGNQPRTTAGGQTIEYGPMYEAVRSISHGKPLVAVTIAEGDYHTPPNLMRLAMAEAAAHGASYLSWPTWPENVRLTMIASVRPEADFLREHADLLNGATPAADVMVFLPFRRWLQTPDCKAIAIAQALGRDNVQFNVVCEDDLERELGEFKGVLVVESQAVLNEAEAKAVQRFTDRGGRLISAEKASWLPDVHSAIKSPTITLHAPPTVRAVVRYQSGKTIVHLLNLNIERLTSFSDKVSSAADVQLSLNLLARSVKSICAVSADVDCKTDKMTWKAKPTSTGSDVDISLPQLSISTILVIE